MVMPFVSEGTHSFLQQSNEIITCQAALFENTGDGSSGKLAMQRHNGPIATFVQCHVAAFAAHNLESCLLQRLDKIMP